MRILALALLIVFAMLPMAGLVSVMKTLISGSIFAAPSLPSPRRNPLD
jgi:hypothetical protein